jgi:hypothetical protein
MCASRVNGADGIEGQVMDQVRLTPGIDGVAMVALGEQRPRETA